MLNRTSAFLSCTALAAGGLAFFANSSKPNFQESSQGNFRNEATPASQYDDKIELDFELAELVSLENAGVRREAIPHEVAHFVTEDIFNLAATDLRYHEEQVRWIIGQRFSIPAIKHGYFLADSPIGIWRWSSANNSVLQRRSYLSDPGEAERYFEERFGYSTGKLLFEREVFRGQEIWSKNYHVTFR